MLGKLLPKSDSACENQSLSQRSGEEVMGEVLSWSTFVSAVSAEMSVASVLYIDLALSWHLPLSLLGRWFCWLSSHLPTQPGACLLSTSRCLWFVFWSC